MEAPKSPLKNVCMIAVTLPDISDAKALEIKSIIATAIEDVEEGSLDMRYRASRGGGPRAATG